LFGVKKLEVAILWI